MEPVRIAYLGHVLTSTPRADGATVVGCLHCGLDETLTPESLESAGLVWSPTEPCPGTEEGRRIIQERVTEAEAQQVKSDDWDPIQPGQPVTSPTIAVPNGYAGTQAEAVGLAVHGVVAFLEQQADTLERYAQTTRLRLQALVAAYPATSFAGPNAAVEEAKEWLAYLESAMPPLGPESATEGATLAPQTQTEETHGQPAPQPADPAAGSA